jgi:hypothetical protein
MNEEPYSLLLAFALEQLYKAPSSVQHAATELRRLHEENTTLRQAIIEAGQNEALNKMPTKIFGPNLEQILNDAGFYRKREWQGLDDNEIQDTDHFCGDVFEFARAIGAKVKEKNNG